MIAIIFLVIVIIGILVYFLVIKKKSNIKPLIINKNKKCDSNEININNRCKKILDKTECKSDSPEFMKLDPNTENTSCTAV